jgi:hypothetical protein
LPRQDSTGFLTASAQTMISVCNVVCRYTIHDFEEKHPTTAEIGVESDALVSANRGTTTHGGVDRHSPWQRSNSNVNRDEIDILSR